jgi:hypothetical protein
VFRITLFPLAALLLFSMGCGELLGIPRPPTFYQDLRGQFDPLKLQLHGGKAPLKLMKLQDDGLRITITPENAAVGSRGVGTRFNVSGDFEITLGYRILKIPEPETGYGVGAAISLRDVNGEWASLQRVCQPKKGHVIVAHRGVPEPVEIKEGEPRPKPKYRSTVEIRPSQANQGELRLKRTGTKLTYLIKDHDNPEFTPVRDVEFSDRELTQIRFDGQTTGGKEGDLLLTEITIDTPATGDLVSRVPQPRSTHWIWIGSACAVAIAALGVGVWVRRRSA